VRGVQDIHGSAHTSGSFPSSLLRQQAEQLSQTTPAAVSQTASPLLGRTSQFALSAQAAGRLRSRLRSQAAASLFADRQASAGPSPLGRLKMAADGSPLQQSTAGREQADLSLGTSAMQGAPQLRWHTDGACSSHQDAVRSSALARTAPARVAGQAHGAKASLEASMTAAAQGARAARFAAEASLEPRLAATSAPALTADRPHAGNSLQVGALLRETMRNHEQGRGDGSNQAASQSGADMRLAIVQQRGQWRSASSGMFPDLKMQHIVFDKDGSTSRYCACVLA
jgi:hypothetical protein